MSVALNHNLAFGSKRSGRSSWRRWKNRAAIGAMAVLLLVCLVPLAEFIVDAGEPRGGEISFTFLSKPWAPVGETGGIAQAIVGSVELLAMASVIAVPLGLANGLYLARRVPGRLASITRLLLDVMTGIPAIVVGVFIYMLVVRSEGFSLQIGFSAIAGSLALAMIMLPIFARASEDALRAVPARVQEAGLALGLSARRVTLRIIVRSAATGILTALFLSLARVAGEAAPLLFTAFGSNDWPGSPTQPVGSLPQLLFDDAREPFEELVRQAWGAALVLVAMVLLVRITTNVYSWWRYADRGAV